MAAARILFLLAAATMAGCGGRVSESGERDAAITDAAEGDASWILPGDDAADAIVAACPASLPDDLSPCGGEVMCTYGDARSPECRDVVWCVYGIWHRVRRDWCVAPAGGCPASPAGASPCKGDAYGTCTYADGTLCYCKYFRADGGSEVRWACFPPPTPPGCPRFVPNAGTSCSRPGSVACEYGDVSWCGPGVPARCGEDGRWIWRANCTE